MNEQISNVLRLCNIESNIDSEFGNWLVMEDGTLVNVGGSFSRCGYVIEPDILESEDWISKFQLQGRLTESFDIPNFRNAYLCACEITNRIKYKAENML